MADQNARQLAREQEQATVEAVEIAEANDRDDGGRYLDTDGKTLVNANGEPIKGKAANDE